MNQTFNNPKNLDIFGAPSARVERAIKQLREGGGILVMDDEDRENEGDIIFPASTITEAQMALLIREGTGIVCLAMTDTHLKALDLPQMVTTNTSGMGTAFTVSIEAKEGVTTGVSAADRVVTIRTAITEGAKPEDLARPGHVFPLRAHPGGITARAGHTEASIDLVSKAGHLPAAVLCELTNPNGTMARLPEIVAFAEAHGMPVVTIEDLHGYDALTQAQVA